MSQKDKRKSDQATKIPKSLEERQADIDRAEGKDNKRGNIGPSGQGSHRGRERSHYQSKASGRPDVPSIGHR